MLSLFILLLERSGLIILLAYLLINISYFKTALANRKDLSVKIKLIMVFGVFALISNYTGVEINKDGFCFSSRTCWKVWPLKPGSG